MSDAETEVSHRGILHLQWEPGQQRHLLHHGLTKEVAAVPGTLSAGSVCMEFSGEYAYLCINGSTVWASGLLSTSAHKTLDGRIFLEGLGPGGPVWLDMLLADQSSWKTLYPEWGCQGLGATSAAFKCSQAPAAWYGCSLFWEVCMLPILLKWGGYASKAKFFSDSWQRFKDICNVRFGLHHEHFPAVRNRGYFFEAATQPADGFKLDFVERSASTMGLIALLSLWSAGQSRGTILDNMQEAGLLLGSMVTEWVVDGKLPLICHSDVALGPHHSWPMPPAGAIVVELEIKGGCLSKSALASACEHMDCQPGRANEAEQISLTSLLKEAARCKKGELKWLALQIVCWLSWAIEHMAPQSCDNQKGMRAVATLRPRYRRWDQAFQSGSAEQHCSGIGRSEGGLGKLEATAAEAPGFGAWRSAWTRKTLLKYFFQCRATMSEATFVSISCDASRVAKRDTLLTAVMNNETGVSMWAPHQAIRRTMHFGGPFGGCLGSRILTDRNLFSNQ